MANTLEGEWQDLALDQGDEILQQNEYYATLDDGNSSISTRITSISYSPSINKVKNLSIDVPSSVDLEDDTYLGETLQVYVDSSLLFEGKVISINTSQVAGEDYSIEAEPPAKKLKGDSVDRDFINELASDALVNIVDESASVSMAMRALRENEIQNFENEPFPLADEVLSGAIPVGGNALKAPPRFSASSAYYRYEEDVSNLEKIIVKAYTPSSATISLTVGGYNSDTDTSFTVDSFTMDQLNQNKYGEWDSFTFSTDSSSEFTKLTFEMDKNCVLFEWITISNDNEFSRNLTIPGLTENTSEKDFSTLPTDKNAVVSSGSMYIVDEEDENVRPRQVTVWNRLNHKNATLDRPFYELYQIDGFGEPFLAFDKRTDLFNDPNRIKEGYVPLHPGEITPNLAQEDAKEIWDGNVESLVYDDMDNLEINIRVQVSQDAPTNPKLNVQFNGESYIYDGSRISSQEPTWITLSTDESFDLEKRAEEILGVAPFHVVDLIDNLRISNTSEGYGISGTRVLPPAVFIIDAIVLSHSPSTEESLNLSFDRSDGPEVNAPKKFASPEHYDTDYFTQDSSFIKETVIEYQPESFATAINEAAIFSTTDISNQRITMGSYQPGIRISIDDRPNRGYQEDTFGFSGPPHNDFRNFEIPGRTFRFQFRPVTVGDTTSDKTPQFGHDREVHSSQFSYNIKFNDANVLSSKSIQDSRLGAMNDIANETGPMFRWDNTTCEIFERGDRQTSVDVYNAKIDSSMDISETYKSCIVKGKYGVQSDKFVANGAPGFVEKQKFIRDSSIETESEANARAKSFINEHSDIEYSGSIDTLPTLAPVGEMMSGSLFNHGQDMVIKSVSYSKTSSNIKLGFTNTFADQMVSLTEKTVNADNDIIQQGIGIPVGENETSSDERKGSDLQ